MTFLCMLPCFCSCSDEIATMNAERILLILVCCSVLSIGARAFDIGCLSPQYVSIGSEGVINCSFLEGFYSLLWYSSLDVFHSEAVLTMVGSVKSGSGYLSGKLDIYPNGSLIIYNASLEDEGTFTAIILETPTSDAIRYVVDVIIIASTLSRLPLILECGNESSICFRILPPHSEVSCKIQDARPAISLSWMVRTNSGDRNVSSSLSITNGTHPFYTSTVTTSALFTYSSILALLVCKAESASGLLEMDESLILIQNGDKGLSSVASVITYVERGSRLVLSCTNTNFSYIAWQVEKPLEATFSNILFAVFVEGNIQYHIEDNDYRLNSEGTLFIDDVTVGNEGTYRCISSNGMEDVLLQFNVTVFVLPDHTYPAVDGCDGQNNCVLEMEPEGSLTCGVRGIRPRIQLEISVFDDQSSEAFLLYAQNSTTQSNGDVFDISLTSKYRLNDASKTRVTVECKLIGPDIEQFDLSTKLDVLFSSSYTTPTEGISIQSNETSTGGHHHWEITAVLIPVPLIGSLMFCLVLFKRKSCKKLLATCSSTEMGGGIPIMKLDDHEEQKRLFKLELKAKYQNLYEAVQPIPFIKDRLYCVDNVIVEGGIEFLVTRNNISKKESWEKLDSYHDILCDPRVKSSRRILEGAPGFGKSTLCLQLAFEWCNQITSSPLTNTEILILLSLSQLGGVKSIFAAIKQFLLQKDTLLTEELIQTILRKSSSVLILLDGFDEYPDQASDEASDIMSIILMEMFIQFDVIMTTRTSHLPKQYSPLTKRLKLSGFDNISRDKYIQKAVVGYDIEAAEKVNERLRYDPILRDIWHVPLIFVMFAHLSSESENFQTFQPVTSYFRYIISCFNSHMKAKMTNGSSQSYDLLEENHSSLGKLAFEGLFSTVRPIFWSKKYMSDKLGKQSYEKYVRAGILVEEELFNLSDDTNLKVVEYIEYKPKVRFFHQLFCEWYAAHYLSNYALLDDVKFDTYDKMVKPRESEVSGGYALSEVFMNTANIIHYPNHVNVKGDDFRNLDPCDCFYFYRFTSGLNFAVAKTIIEYLKGKDGTDNFITLCKLEQYGQLMECMQEVKDFCSTDTTIHTSYSVLLQRSTIQLLEIASKNKIPILSLNLRECYRSVNFAGDNCIHLKSGLSVPLLTTLKKLIIEERGREITPEEIANILQYSSSSSALEELWFWECLLPQSCFAESSTPRLSRDFEVMWYPHISTLSSPVYKLDLQTGFWKCDGEKMTDEEYERVIRKVRSFKQLQTVDDNATIALPETLTILW